MSRTSYRQYLLRSRPVGMLQAGDFELREQPLRAPEEGEVRVRVVYLSLDPANRVWMSDAPGYIPPIPIGEVVRALGLGVVEASRDAGYQDGDLVSGLLGWQEYATGSPERLRLYKIPQGLPVPMPAILGALSPTGGFTAYWGMMEIGKPVAGETVVVSAASGSVGSIAGQIAKIHGCRVVGITGGPEKCRYVTEDLGFDACLDRSQGDLVRALGEACPNGIDIDFENAGGAILDAVLAHINLRARIVLCGLISQYTQDLRAEGPRRFSAILTKRARVEGFIIIDHMDHYPAAVMQLARWIADGKIKHREEIAEGLENAPATLNRLFAGDKLGKLVLRVSPEP